MDFGGQSRSESKSRSNGSSSGSGGGSTGRGHVHMKLRYGTKTFEPDTKCVSCGSKAEGVLKTKSDGLARPMAICEDKREEIEDEYGDKWEMMTYKRFEEEEG